MGPFSQEMETVPDLDPWTISPTTVELVETNMQLQSTAEQSLLSDSIRKPGESCRTHSTVPGAKPAALPNRGA